MRVNGTPYRTVWIEGGTVKLIEQRRLPVWFEICSLPSSRDTAEGARCCRRTWLRRWHFSSRSGPQRSRGVSYPSMVDCGRRFLGQLMTASADRDGESQRCIRCMRYCLERLRG